MDVKTIQSSFGNFYGHPNCTRVRASKFITTSSSAPNIVRSSQSSYRSVRSPSVVTMKQFAQSVMQLCSVLISRSLSSKNASRYPMPRRATERARAPSRSHYTKAEGCLRTRKGSIGSRPVRCGRVRFGRVRFGRIRWPRSSWWSQADAKSRADAMVRSKGVCFRSILLLFDTGLRSSNGSTTRRPLKKPSYWKLWCRILLLSSRNTTLQPVVYLGFSVRFIAKILALTQPDIIPLAAASAEGLIPCKDS